MFCLFLSKFALCIYTVDYCVFLTIICYCFVIVFWFCNVIVRMFAEYTQYSSFMFFVHYWYTAYVHLYTLITLNVHPIYNIKCSSQAHVYCCTLQRVSSPSSYFLPCQRWLAVKEDDGQIARELVPVDKALKKKLSRKDSMAIRNEIALETAGT